MSKDKIEVKDILAYNEILKLIDHIDKSDLLTVSFTRGRIISEKTAITNTITEITGFEKLLDQGVYGSYDDNLQDTIPYNLYNRIGSLLSYPSPVSRANLKKVIENTLKKHRKDLEFLNGVLKKLDNV